MATRIGVWAKWAAAAASDQAAKTGGTVSFNSKGTGRFNTAGSPDPNGVTSIGVYEVWQAQSGGNTPPSSRGRGGGNSSGTNIIGGNISIGIGGAGGAGTVSQPGIAAMQAGLPQFTGGGADFGIQAGQTQRAVPQRADDWRGINSYTPDNKLQSSFSPRALNWDGIRRPGSRCLRDGVAKNTDDIDTMTASGGGALSSEYRGRSLAVIPGTGTVGDLLVFSFGDKDVDLGTAPGGSNSVASHHVCTIGPRWGKPWNLTNLPGPTLSASDQGSQVARVTAVHDKIPTAQVGLRKQTVVAIIIRYVGPVSASAVPRWPMDPDNPLDIDKSGSTSLKDRVAWDGSSTNYDTPTLSGAGKVWFAAWTVSREGISRPSFANVVIA